LGAPWLQGASFLAGFPMGDGNHTGIISLPDGQLRPLVSAYESAVAKNKLHKFLFLLALLAAVAWSFWMAEIKPLTFIEKIDGFTSYFDRISRLDSGAHVWTDPVEWFWGLRKWLKLMFETLLISYLGTLIGGIGAFALCFLSSANINSLTWLRFVSKRLLEFFRTVPDIVFALVFVVAFGVGPLPGVLAIMVHTTGALGKQFSEVVENIDMKPVEGLRAAGGNMFQIIRFAVLPQVMGNFLSYGLLRYEINVRGATVMGFVGAGGIGDEFLLAIRRFYYSDVSAILVIIIMTVFVIDMLTTRLRRKVGVGDRV
jgi:phosphonate transport system permease protein